MRPSIIFLSTFPSISLGSPNANVDVTKENAELEPTSLSRYSSSAGSYDNRQGPHNIEEARSARSMIYQSEKSARPPSVTYEETKRDQAKLFVKPKSGINDEDECHSVLSTRSPVRAAQQGVDIAESAKSYKWNGREGAVILHGVGERWKAEQTKAALKAQHYLADDMLESHLLQYNFQDLRRSKDLRLRRAMWRDVKRGQNIRDNLQTHWQASNGQVRQRGQDIEHLGAVNRDIRNRMKKFFDPLPNRNRERDRYLARLAQARPRARGRGGRRAERGGRGAVRGAGRGAARGFGRPGEIDRHTQGAEPTERGAGRGARGGARFSAGRGRGRGTGHGGN